MEPESRVTMTDRGWPSAIRTVLLIEVGILAVAALLRLLLLDIKPAHFDEGINGWFCDQMRVHGFYRYDPENYHGPLWFYLLFASLSILGRNLWALRLPAVAASLASVWLTFRFDRFLGTRAACLAALAMALSPAEVFYGRYAIHEPLFALSLMITAYGLLGIWRDGTRRDLAITVAGVTLLLLLKETAVIHIVSFLLAGVVLLFWEKIVPSCPTLTPARRGWCAVDLGRYLLIALLALAVLYSGTFFNWQGIPDFFRAYAKWFQTGTGAGGHEKTDFQIGHFAFLNWYWIALMLRYEWPALLGLAVAVRLAWPAPAIPRYLAIYGLGVLAAYSIIPYKTPWCILSILWPFLFLFGWGIAELASLRRSSSIRLSWISWISWIRTAAAVVALFLLCGSLLLSVRLNYRHFTDPAEPYVYVQTQPGIRTVTDPVLGLVAQDPRNRGLTGHILLESYYPLPWIFGEMTSIGYYGKETLPNDSDADFIVALTSDRVKIESRLKEPYLRVPFRLRDSMEECTVWFRESRFGSWFDRNRPERVLPGQRKSIPAAKPSPTPSAAPSPGS